MSFYFWRERKMFLNKGYNNLETDKLICKLRDFNICKERIFKIFIIFQRI